MNTEELIDRAMALLTNDPRASEIADLAQEYAAALKAENDRLRAKVVTLTSECFGKNGYSDTVKALRDELSAQKAALCQCWWCQHHDHPRGSKGGCEFNQADAASPPAKEPPSQRNMSTFCVVCQRYADHTPCEHFPATTRAEGWRTLASRLQDDLTEWQRGFSDHEIGLGIAQKAAIDWRALAMDCLEAVRALLAIAPVYSPNDTGAALVEFERRAAELEKP